MMSTVVQPEQIPPVPDSTGTHQLKKSYSTVSQVRAAATLPKIEALSEIESGSDVAAAKPAKTKTLQENIKAIKLLKLNKSARSQPGQRDEEDHKPGSTNGK